MHTPQLWVGFVVQECIWEMRDHGSFPFFISQELCHLVSRILVYEMMHEVFFIFFTKNFFLISYDEKIMILYDEIRLQFEI